MNLHITFIDDIYNMKNKFVITTLLCTALLGVAYIMDHLSSFSNFWQNLPLGTAGKFAEYCEQNRMNAFLRQEMNSYSNIGFIFVGILLLLSHNVGRLPYFFTMYYGSLMIFLGIGSGYYHASLTLDGQRWDMLGTYGIPLSALVLSIHGVTAKHRDKLLYVLTALLVTFLIFYFISPFYNLSGKILPPVFLITAGLTVIYVKNEPHKKPIYLGVAAIISLAMAISFRTIDVKKIACDPESIYQGHSLWHFLTAASAYYIYQIYNYRQVS